MFMHEIPKANVLYWVHHLTPKISQTDVKCYCRKHYGSQEGVQIKFIGSDQKSSAQHHFVKTKLPMTSVMAVMISAVSVG